MRLLSIVLTLVLLVCFLGFVVTNLDARIGVTVWKTHHEDVSLHLVVILSLLAGALWVGIIGIGQGIQMWLVNRRLSRDIQKLEAELNYFRTQPVTRTASDADSADEGESPRSSESARDARDDGVPLPSAPVYGPDDDGDPDDDVYSGGRAV
jgi:hypothetical protein